MLGICFSITLQDIVYQCFTDPLPQNILHKKNLDYYPPFLYHPNNLVNWLFMCIFCWLGWLLTSFPNLFHFRFFSFDSCLIFVQLLEDHVLVMAYYIFKGWILCSFFRCLTFIGDPSKPIFIHVQTYFCVLLDLVC